MVTRASYEIRHKVDDFISFTVAGLAAGLEFWEIAFIPMLLYNAETWQEVGKEVFILEISPCNWEELPSSAVKYTDFSIMLIRTPTLKSRHQLE